MKEVCSSLTLPPPPNQSIPHGLPPGGGIKKINVDRAVFKEMRCCGVGIVIRNKRGQSMGAMSKRMDLPLRALETKAKAVEEGVLLAWDLSLKNIIVESNALIIVNFLTEHSQLPSSIHKESEGTKTGLRCFESWEVNHIYRARNSAAHLMDRQAKFISNYNVWVEDTPYFIANQIQLDVTYLNINFV